MPKLKTSNFIVRGIDPKLWRQLKAKAALDGKPLREIFTRLIERYVKDGLP